MKAKLFLFYLRFRKPIIIITAILAATIIGLDNWQRYKYRTADYTPWTLVSVNSGSTFTVTRHDKTKVINLCGVKASGDKAKDFLQSVINLGDGTVELEQIGDRYEAWILLAQDYDIELVKHISTKPNELIEGEIHLNTWVIEHGYAKQDRQSSSNCREPEHLAWAESIAKENKLGVWQDASNLK